MSRKASIAATHVFIRRSDHVKHGEGKAEDNKRLKSSTPGVGDGRLSKARPSSRRAITTATGLTEKSSSRSSSASSTRRSASASGSSQKKSAHAGHAHAGHSYLSAGSHSRDVMIRSGSLQHGPSDQRLSSSLRLLRPQSPTSSIWSAQTEATGTSSSSNRTVTQTCYLQAQDSVKSGIDVFRYLVDDKPAQKVQVKRFDHERDEDEAEWGSDSDSDSGSSNGSCATSCCGDHTDGRTGSMESSGQWDSGQWDSGQWDSGVSMGGDSPILARRRPRSASEPRRLAERSMRDSLEQNGALDEHQVMPGAFTKDYTQPSETSPPAPSPPPAYKYPSHPTRPHQAHEIPKIKTHGYDLVARVYCSEGFDAVTPIYRRFDLLQHRTLLHLQDQICELEAELKLLDDQVAVWTTGEDGQHQPQSRRLDRVHPNIGSRRHYILECLGHCLAQYNQMLASHQTVASECDRPSEQQIGANRTWFRANQAIVADETGFLEHESDLLVLKKHAIYDTRDWLAFARGGIAGFTFFVFVLILCKFT